MCSRLRKDVYYFLANLLIAELTKSIDTLIVLLTNNSRSEAGLTAIADLAIITSILKRDHPGIDSFELADAILALLENPVLRPRFENPGPEEWALHVARVCLNIDKERERLSSSMIIKLIEDSKRVVLSLGPPWRLDEVAYVETCVTGSDLPKLRTISIGAYNISLYELTHNALYATDFGRVSIEGAITNQLASTATEALSGLVDTEEDWDLGTELLLAVKFLTGKWPIGADVWLEKLMPKWSQNAVSKLHSHPDLFMSLYHQMSITALTFSQYAKNGR